MASRKANNSKPVFRIIFFRGQTLTVLYTIAFFLILISCQNLGNDKSNQASDKKNNAITFTPEILIESLPKKVRETSGLAQYDDLIWTINDSGGGNIIYGLNKISGKVKREIVIKKAKNHDWEALASDEDFIYIADVGNNKGNRTDLKVYKVNKKSLKKGNEDAKSDAIFFTYPDQKVYLRTKRRTRFDCEAMISYGDSLILFTKDWFTYKTTMYSLPKEPGSYEARYMDTFKANGLITGADISEDGKVLVLCGYSNFDPFLWVFEDYQGTNFFDGNITRIEYPSFRDAQTEAVLFLGDSAIAVSAERSPSYPQRLYSFPQSIIMQARDE